MTDPNAPIIEAMARAICDVDCDSDNLSPRPNHWRIYIDHATAALAALRKARGPITEPCPCCGFRVREVERVPFTLPED